MINFLDLQKINLRFKEEIESKFGIYLWKFGALAANKKARDRGFRFLIKTLMDEFAKSKKCFDFGISAENGGKFLNQGLISRSIMQYFWEINIRKVCNVF